MTRTTFPETALVRLPAGTLALIREAANLKGTTLAEIMRQAVLHAVTIERGRKTRRQGKS
jgi:hypothetical protein